MTQALSLIAGGASVAALLLWAGRAPAGPEAATCAGCGRRQAHHHWCAYR